MDCTQPPWNLRPSFPIASSGSRCGFCGRPGGAAWNSCGWWAIRRWRRLSPTGRSTAPSLTLLYLKVSREFRETMRLSIRVCTEQRRRESERRKASVKVEAPTSGELETSRCAAASDELDAMRAMIPADEAAAEQLAREDAAQPGPSETPATEPAQTAAEKNPDVVALADRITSTSRTRRAELLGHAAQAPNARAALAAAILERRRRA
jgi:hypothetical protein